MRWIFVIAATLFGLGWIACQIELVGADVSQPQLDDGWRRTALGWERLVVPKSQAADDNLRFWRSHPHPFVATLFLLLACILLLVAFTDEAELQLPISLARRR